MPDFTTLAAVKVALNIIETGQDAAIAALIPQVTATMLSVMRRPNFWQSGSDVTEYPRVRGCSDTLVLDRFPGVVVTSIHESCDVPRVYDSTTLLVADADYIVDPDTGLVERTASAWARGLRAIKVIYNGGYASGAAPADLGVAAVMIMSATLTKSWQRWYHLTAAEIGEGGYQGIIRDDIPMTAREILEYHRDARLG